MQKLQIEIPVKIKSEGKGIGDDIAKQIKGSLGSIGVGNIKGGGSGSIGGMGKSLGIIGGTLGAILAVVKSIDYIIKPVMALFKAILAILFLPLIPILKPVLQLLSETLKLIAPFMKKLSQGKEGSKPFGESSEANTALGSFARAIGNTAFQIGEAIGNIVYEIGKAAFELGNQIGQWLYDKVIVPLGNFVSDVIWKGLEPLINIGIQIWNQILKPAFSWFTGIGEKIWNFIKSLFIGTIDVGKSVFDMFKSFFVGTIKVASTVWNWFKGLFSGGSSGKTTSVGDAIIRPNGDVIKTDPSDYLIATKTPGSLGGGSTIININNPQVRQTSDIKAIANEVSKVLRNQIAGRVSSGI